MTKQPEIKRVIELQQLILSLRKVKRAIHIPPDNNEAESDVEHSYSLALTGWFLADYFPKLNRDTIIRLALAHDLLEVHSGDTFVYGSKDHIKTKGQREQAAIKQLKKDWPDFPGIHEAIAEYEERGSEEAKFVYALDKLMPAIVNYMGSGYVWKKHGVTLDMFIAEKEAKIPHSPEIYDYYQQLLTILQKQPELFTHG